MLKSYFVRFFYGFCALAAFTSCGGEKAAGTGEFATVFATVSGPNSTIDSDVARWVDATSGAAAAACGATSVPTTTPDSAVFTVTSTPYAAPNTGSGSAVTPSPLSITRITVTMTPADSISPALPAIFQTQFPSSAAPVILPGNPQPLTVRLVDNDMKAFFLFGLGAQSITCTNQATYSYRAVVSFEMLETTTNRVSTVTAPGFMLIKFSDFIDA